MLRRLAVLPSREKRREAALAALAVLTTSSM